LKKLIWVSIGSNQLIKTDYCYQIIFPPIAAGGGGAAARVVLLLAGAFSAYPFISHAPDPAITLQLPSATTPPPYPLHFFCPVAIA
jgi:hypothetical protein